MRIEIFKTGKHRDSAGKEREWTEDDLDKIASSYDPMKHEAPVVIGHPKDNAPAFGWVESLKREGPILFARLKDLVPEFVEMVKKGLFKKRSVSLYPDLTLRHLGFLGAVPPAVKGLKDIRFEDAAASYEFQVEEAHKKKGGEAMSWKEKIKAVFSKAIDELPEDPNAPKAFSESEVKAREEEAAKKGREQAALEFAEEGKKKEKDLKAREEAIKAKERDAAKAEIVSFIEGLKKEGKVIPAMEQVGAGITSFLIDLSSSQSVLEYKEGEETKRETPLEFMKVFLSGLPKMVEFREVATRGKDVGGDEETKRKRLIADYSEKNPNVSYKDAVLAVSKEHPELFKNR